MSTTTETMPTTPADGQFDTYLKWVQKARSWIGGTGAKCFDAKGRPCRIGADFMRADEEKAFPVRYWIPEPDESFERTMFGVFPTDGFPDDGPTAMFSDRGDAQRFANNPDRGCDYCVLPVMVKGDWRNEAE